MFETVLTHTMSLWGLFSLSFIAATLLPAGSEVLLTAMILAEQYSVYSLIAVATIGNTLGGFLTYYFGWLARCYQKNLEIKQQKVIIYMQRYGIYCLLFSWLPIFGDIFCFAAGWLKLNRYWSGLLLLLGKLLRYSFIALIAQGLI
ncbi:DedA family protein [Motilimonas cestriensis]|uniref:DedA family protein n=1 Tax=Motilimonas cestriensis TaxID=2742685 RepID=A0ABS8WFA5_9GAMM|nr:DedA family protein [Motilimonas cestriensis]MCE2596239.1 DedA family protein [Motilimonas cestriensis]